MIRKVLQNNKVLIVLVYPASLLATMYIAFQMLVSELGFHTGYLVAFAIYWIGWGFLFPILVLGGFKGILDLFKTQKARTKEEEKKFEGPSI
jgi:hypothetical protein